MKTEMIRALRGALLRACMELYPGPAMLSTLRWIGETFGSTLSEIEVQLAYFEGHGWIRIVNVELIGVPDKQITLTPAGVDVATGIDPEKPIL
ncbi:hypothetical protein IT570_03555 [Candidatus Sumerlaeota bacterium]|nr:hypothetical protein [Candidatus Sumerlaeota bacterium]